MKARRAIVGALAVAFALSSCITGESTELVIEEASVAETVESEPLAEPEPPRERPQWEQSTSIAEFSRCKLLDPRPDSIKALFRGQKRGDAVGRDNVGFPRTERDLPGLGEVNIIVAKVAFNDAPPSNKITNETLEEQLRLMSEWSEFWSQGKMTYSFQFVDEWVQVPVDHADYVVDPGVGDNEYDQEEFQRQVQERLEEIAQLTVSEFPSGLDWGSADAVFVYWSPEITEFKQSVGVRSKLLSTPAGDMRVTLSGGGIYHYSDAGNISLSTKQEFMWTWWIHEFLHFQGMNGHAPGEGWPTGVGQGAYPANNEYSGALSAWETFLFEWLDDSQVHCSDKETLVDTERVILTPLEIFGGERKMIAIRADDYKVIVVESRRPVGWSKWWPGDREGLFVYEVDADGVHTDHVPDDCGNDPKNPKWAYYLYPDSVEDTSCRPNDLDRILVKEGMSVTHSGIRITLEYSDDDSDYVTVEKIADER